MKFGTVTHIGPLHRIVLKNFEILKIQHGAGRHLENHKKSRYLHRAARDHTLARYCESVVKATMKVYGKGGNLTPRYPKTP